MCRIDFNPDKIHKAFQNSKLCRAVICDTTRENWVNSTNRGQVHGWFGQLFCSVRFFLQKLVPNARQIPGELAGPHAISRQHSCPCKLKNSWMKGYYVSTACVQKVSSAICRFLGHANAFESSIKTFFPMCTLYKWRSETKCQEEGDRGPHCDVNW